MSIQINIESSCLRSFPVLAIYRECVLDNDTNEILD